MCALKVSLSTAKGKRMPAQGRLAAVARLLRLLAAASLIVALAAIATIVNGDGAAKSRALILLSIMLGSLVLLGTALLAHAYIRKDPNDPRS
jgi:hypothetical protein